MSEHLCLIIDGEPTVRTLLRTILERRQLHIIEAGDAESGLKVVQRREGRLDLIVSEISTPGELSGVDLARSVRDAFPPIPIILISRYGDNPAGFDFVPKPFIGEAFLSAVENALNGGPPRAAVAGAA